MKIMNADRAVADITKLRYYCLNKQHPGGKHKAHLFENTFGLTDVDAEELRDTLLEIVRSYDATEGKHDQYGKRYIIDFIMERRDKKATVRNTWIIRNHEDFPRLTNC